MLKTALLIFILVSAAVPALAQGPLGPGSEPPDVLMRDAVATPYADALLKTFAASVRRHADSACRQARGLDDAAAITRGRAILERHGIRMMQVAEDMVDRAAYRAELSASLGADAEAELARLESDPVVKQYIALGRPARLARVLDLVLEQFDRYLLVARIKFDTISPEGRGEPALPENPIEAAEAVEQEFYDKASSPQLNRYVELLEAATIAMQKAINLDKAAQFSPEVIFRGVDSDLAELCVGPR